jgi:probable HAF family extracellular repeat protein
MKSRRLARILALAFCAAITSMTNSFQLAAQSPTTTTYRYRAVDLGTLGGPSSSGCIPECRYVNNEGSAIFRADTPAPDPFPDFCLGDCFATLANRWQNGRLTTLNPVPGGVDTFPAWISDTNLVAGYSENGLLDPTSGFPEFVATLWQSGSAINLGTLGGTSSLAWGVNNSGEVVGGALNLTADPTFPAPFFYYNPVPFPVFNETHAFLWSHGVMQDLQTLGGPDSFAQFVNATGQAAGVSFTNSVPNATTGSPTLDPFLWARGKMNDLGTLGGTLGFANGLNDLGHVIGQSNLAGDATYHPFLWTANPLTDLQTLGGNNGSAIWINNADEVVGWADLPGSQVHHAFLWKNGVMTDLGTVGTDPCTTAYGLNAKGQVVGNLGDGSGLGTCGPKVSGFLWENGGPMVDLATLFAPLSSGLTMFGSCCIADDGTILGSGKLPNGDSHAMLLIPCDAKHEDAPACHVE